MVQSPVQSAQSLESVCRDFAADTGIELVAVPHRWFFDGGVSTKRPYVDDPRLVRMQPPISLDLAMLDFSGEGGRSPEEPAAFYGHTPSRHINLGYMSFNSNGVRVGALSVEDGTFHVFVRISPGGRDYTVYRTDKRQRGAGPSVTSNMGSETLPGYLRAVFSE